MMRNSFSSVPWSYMDVFVSFWLVLEAEMFWYEKGEMQFRQPNFLLVCFTVLKYLEEFLAELQGPSLSSQQSMEVFSTNIWTISLKDTGSLLGNFLPRSFAALTFLFGEVQSKNSQFSFPKL